MCSVVPAVGAEFSATLQRFLLLSRGSSRGLSAVSRVFPAVSEAFPAVSRVCYCCAEFLLVNRVANVVQRSLL